MENNLNLNDGLSRRAFVERIAYSLLGVSAMANPSFAAEQAVGNRFGKAKHVIYIYLSGGASHTDTFDPKTDPLINTGVAPINTKGEFQIAGYFPKLAQHGDKFSVIRSLSSKTGSHEAGQYVVRTSYNKNSLIIHPTLGSLSYYLLGKQHASIPDNILISGDSNNSKGGYLSKQFYPISISNPDEGLRYAKSLVDKTKFNSRYNILNQLDKNFQKTYNNREITAYDVLYDETLKLMNSKDLELFDLNKEDNATKERYGKTQFGSGLLLAKRLIKSGVRYVDVSTGSMDYHSDINQSMTRKSLEMDAALAALFEDLAKEGLIKETLVVIATEFGRTPKINSNQGKDHHPAAFSCVLGGLDLGGRAIGKTADDGSTVKETPISIGEFNSSIGYLLGIKPDRVWTSPPESSAPGRPFTIGNGAKPISFIM
jgi:uncharacterized protein (DUF1501 family)